MPEPPAKYDVDVQRDEPAVTTQVLLIWGKKSTEMMISWH